MPRLSITAFFFVNGLVFASWVPHIPAVKTRLALSDSRLGLLLLAMAVGSLAALALAGWVVGRFGSRRTTVASGTLLCLLLPMLVLSPGVASVAACLLLFGVATALLDVAMNAQASALESRYGRPIMSSFHGFYSLGGLAGAALAGGLMASGIGPAPHVLGVCAVALATAGIGAAGLLPSAPASGPAQAVLVRPTRATLHLGLLAAAALLVEGAVGDWSAVYLRDTLLATPASAAAGFAAFSLTMAAGRFGGDALARRVGRQRLLQLSGTLAALGLLIAAAANAQVALLGFAVAGIGLANVIPLLFSAAARSHGIEPGQALAAVASAGYCGYLVGPPLIGVTGDALTLRASMVLLALLCGTVAWHARQIGSERPGRAAQPAA